MSTTTQMSYAADSSSTGGEVPMTHTPLRPKKKMWTAPGRRALASEDTTPSVDAAAQAHCVPRAWKCTPASRDREPHDAPRSMTRPLNTKGALAQPSDMQLIACTHVHLMRRGGDAAVSSASADKHKEAAQSRVTHTNAPKYTRKYNIWSRSPALGDHGCAATARDQITPPSRRLCSRRPRTRRRAHTSARARSLPTRSL